MSKIRSIAIIGAGNGGCAAAVEFTLAGFDVRLYGRSPSTLEPILARGGLDYEGVLGDGFTPIGQVTPSAQTAMQGADLVLMMGPTHAHAAMAAVIAPHLTDRQILMVTPGHTLTLIPDVLRAQGHRAPTLCETSTLPYICRKVSGAHIRVSRKPAELRFAAFPADRTAALAERLRPVFPALVPVPSVLHTVFPYTNAIHHPPALLCNIGRVESTGGDFRHYAEGITPSVGRIIDALDGERQAVARAFGAEVGTLAEHFHRIGYTDDQGLAGGNAHAVFQHSEPNRWIKAPATIDHRFFNEDIPFGLVLLAELGMLAGVRTPVSESVICLAGIARGVDYRAGGLTLRRLGLEGLDVNGLRRRVDRGYDA